MAAREFALLFTIYQDKMDAFEEAVKETKADDTEFSRSLEQGSINVTVSFNTFSDRQEARKILSQFGRAELRFDSPRFS